MSRQLLILGLLLAGCGKDDGGKKNKGSDTGSEGTLEPPAACPVGDLALTDARVQGDLALVDAWNDLRAAPVPCSDGTTAEVAPAVQTADALMWTARCWARDISLNGQPAASDSFSDGTTLAVAATDQGFGGILVGWAVQGGLAEPEEALDKWLAGEPTACGRLWDDSGTVGAMAASAAGDQLVVVRLLAVEP